MTVCQPLAHCRAGLTWLEQVKVDRAPPDVHMAHALSLQLRTGSLRSRQVHVRLLMRFAHHSPHRPLGEAHAIEVRVARNVRVVRADQRQSPAAGMQDTGPAQQKRAYGVDEVGTEAVQKAHDTRQWQAPGLAAIDEGQTDARHMADGGAGQVGHALWRLRHRRTDHHDHVIAGQQLADGGHEASDDTVDGRQPGLRHYRDAHPASIVATTVEVQETGRRPADYRRVSGSVDSRAVASTAVGLAPTGGSSPGSGVHRPQPDDRDLPIRLPLVAGGSRRDSSSPGLRGTVGEAADSRLSARAASSGRHQVLDRPDDLGQAGPPLDYYQPPMEAAATPSRPEACRGLRGRRAMGLRPQGWATGCWSTGTS